MSRNSARMVSTVANLEKLELKRLKTRVERLVSALEEALESESDSVDTFIPAVDLKENGDRVVIQAELPGITGDDVEVSISAKEVMIEGFKNHSNDTKTANSHFCCERRFGHFQRRIVLHWAININKAVAEIKDGILRVELPKLTDRRGKSVKIEVRSEG